MEATTLNLELAFQSMVNDTTNEQLDVGVGKGEVVPVFD
jgi:hypothetical protein